MSADLKQQWRNHTRASAKKLGISRDDLAELLDAWDDSGEAEKRPTPAVVSDTAALMRKEFKKKETLFYLTKNGAQAMSHPSCGQAHAYRGVGKSNVDMGMIKALVTGGDFTAFSCGRDGKDGRPLGFKVMYVDGELGGEDVQELIETVGVEHENFFVITGEEQPDGIPSLASHEGQQWLEEAIEKSGAEVVFLDSWSTLGRVPTNDEENWMNFVAWQMKMRLRGVTTVYNHHDGKGGTQRGSSRSEDHLNWSIQLKWENGYEGGEGLKCRLKFDKARKPVKGLSCIDIELSETPDGEHEWVYSEPKKESAGTEKPKSGRKAKPFTAEEETKLRDFFEKNPKSSDREAEANTGVKRGRVRKWAEAQKAKPEEPKQRTMYDKSEGEESDEPSDM